MADLAAKASAPATTSVRPGMLAARGADAAAKLLDDTEWMALTLRRCRSQLYRARVLPGQGPSWLYYNRTALVSIKPLAE